MAAETEVLGFNIWTKNMPQDYLGLYVEAAQARSLPLIAVVDDVLPAVTFKRTETQTSEFNSAYKNVMDGLGFSSIHFVSDMLKERRNDLHGLYAMSKRVSLPAFMALLPEKKQELLADLTLGEIVDTCWQLHVLEQGMSYAGITRYLTGKRSTAMFRQAKRAIDRFEFDIID